jgi:hypothetical protein
MTNLIQSECFVLHGLIQRIKDMKADEVAESKDFAELVHELWQVRTQKWNEAQDVGMQELRKKLKRYGQLEAEMVPQYHFTYEATAREFVAEQEKLFDRQLKLDWEGPGLYELRKFVHMTTGQAEVRVVHSKDQ